VTGETPQTADDALLRAARAGDRAALEELLVRYQPRVYRFGMRMCGDVEDASDVMQDTLLAMAQSLETFRGDASVSTWLYTIARRFCLRKRRKSTFAPTHEESLDAADSRLAETLPSPAEPPDDTVARHEIASAVDRAIGALDPGQREVLVLRDIEGLSAREVAEVVGLSVDAVKSRLHRARVAVRQALTPVLPDRFAPAPGPECPDVLTMLSRHLEDDLPGSACAALEAHVSRCPSCQGACDSLKRALVLCRETPARQTTAQAEPAVRDAVRRFLAEARPARAPARP